MKATPLKEKCDDLKIYNFLSWLYILNKCVFKCNWAHAHSCVHTQKRLPWNCMLNLLNIITFSTIVKKSTSEMNHTVTAASERQVLKQTTRQMWKRKWTWKGHVELTSVIPLGWVHMMRVRHKLQHALPQSLVSVADYHWLYIFFFHTLTSTKFLSCRLMKWVFKQWTNNLANV